jgi:hypothetical protein
MSRAHGGHRSEEAWRTATAEAWIVEAQQRVADLSGKIVDLCIRHEEAVTDAKDAGEKLLALIKHAHKDQVEAQKVKVEHDELLWASGQFQSDLGSIRREHEHALDECDEAHQECIIARKEQDTATE